MKTNDSKPNKTIMKRKKAKREKLKAINDINEKIIEALSDYAGSDNIWSTKAHGLRVAALVNQKAIIKSHPLPPKVKKGCDNVGERGPEVMITNFSKASRTPLEESEIRKTEQRIKDLKTNIEGEKLYKELVKDPMYIFDQVIKAREKGEILTVGELKVSKKAPEPIKDLLYWDVDKKTLCFNGREITKEFEALDFVRKHNDELCNQNTKLKESFAIELAEHCDELEKENKQYKAERKEYLINVDLLHQLCYKHIPENEVFEYMKLIVKL